MKNILTILSIFLFGVLNAQTRKDTIGNNLNIKYLNSLLLEVSNEITKDSGITYKYNDIAFKCAEYQSSYLSVNAKIHNQNKNWHRNYKEHRGVLLNSLSDRQKYFDTKQTLGSVAENCTLEYLDPSMTYETLAKSTIQNFLDSEPHKNVLLGKIIKLKFLSYSATEGTYTFHNGIGVVTEKVVFVVGYFSEPK